MQAHGWINGVTWGILFPLVIVLAHSLRRELSAWWFQLHRAIAFLALIGAIAGVASGAGLSNDDYHPNGAGGAHKALGIIALVAVVVQVSLVGALQEHTTSSHAAGTFSRAFPGFSGVVWKRPCVVASAVSFKCTAKLQRWTCSSQVLLGMTAVQFMTVCAS